jgi:hypothetical protein
MLVGCIRRRAQQQWTFLACKNVNYLCNDSGKE